MTARLTTQILVAVLRRQVESEGGTAVILNRGDPQAGGLLVVLAERGEARLTLERRTGWDGELTWDRRLGSTESSENRQFDAEMLQRRISADPDLWAIELDIADSERFAAQMDGLS